MPLIISSSVVLDALPTFDPDLPLIGYDNIVTTANVAADTEEANFPASRLANPATHLYWLGADTTEQYVTVTTDGVTEVEYIGIAAHNFGTAGIIVSVEVLDTGVSPPVWTEIEAEALLADDAPIMWRVDPQLMPQFRIRMQSGSAPPRMAVLQAGSLLIMERKLYSGHVPISQARVLDVSNGRSETGQFLGRNIIGEWRATTAAFRLFTPAWYRANMPAFLEASRDRPFFFVWRPDTYPDEVGFCWLTDDPRPTPADPGSNNLIAFELKLAGVA